MDPEETDAFAGLKRIGEKLLNFSGKAKKQVGCIAVHGPPLHPAAALLVANTQPALDMTFVISDRACQIGRWLLCLSVLSC